MPFDRGFLSPYFVTETQAMEAVLADPRRKAVMQDVALVTGGQLIAEELGANSKIPEKKAPQPQHSAYGDM